MNNSLLEMQSDQTAIFPAGDNAVTSLRQFLYILGEQSSPKNLYPSGEDKQHVLLDVFVDGFRYLLIRVEPMHAILSPREREIVRLIARGLPNKAIAVILEISPWTVATHLRRIFVKLEVSSRAEMVARIRKDDLFSD